MPKPQPETLVRNDCCAYLSTRKDVFFFLHDSQGRYDPQKRTYIANQSPYRKKGVADVLGIWRGLPLAIEFKAGKGTLSPEQKAFKTAWTAHGGVFVVVWSLDELIAAMAVLDASYDESEKHARGVGEVH